MLLRTALRAASLWVIWRWLAPRWRSTLALVVGWLMVSLLHAEYVEYVQITERTELLWLAYVLKWLIVLVGTAAWIWLAILSPDTRPESDGARSPVTEKHTEPDSDDGFDFLRQKPQLESRADQVLQSKSENTD